MAQGTRIAARTRPRPRNGWFISIAAAKPSTNSSATVTTVNFSVNRMS